MIAAGMRIYKQLQMPLHVRWELYPVKHEEGKKAEYGGSYMEEVNWWEKEKRTSLYNEIKYMIPEILFLRGLKEENSRLWNISFPFHFALYLIIATLGLLVLGAFFLLAGYSVGPGQGIFSSLLFYLTFFCGSLGLIMGTGATAALFGRRRRNPELRNYSSFADYWNLGFIFVFFHINLLAWLFQDRGFDGARAYVYSLLTLGRGPEGMEAGHSLLGTLAIILASWFIAYLPLTHMSHMFMKYFMYHSVKWEDTPNVKGGKMEAAILENLGLKPTWSAPHIGADGKKSWGEIATSGPKEKK